jgi:hypothetical protein
MRLTKGSEAARGVGAGLISVSFPNVDKLPYKLQSGPVQMLDMFELAQLEENGYVLEHGQEEGGPGIRGGVLVWLRVDVGGCTTAGSVDFTVSLRVVVTACATAERVAVVHNIVLGR